MEWTHLVKRQLNDTNYVLQKSIKSRLFVAHIDRMRRFHSNLSKEGVKDPQDITTMQDKPPELTGVQNLGTPDEAVGQAD